MDAWRIIGSEWLRIDLLSRSRSEHLNLSCLQKATRLVLLQHANRDLGLCHRRNWYGNKVLPATNEIKVFTCLAYCPLMPSRRLVFVCSSTTSSTVFPAIFSQPEPKGPALRFDYDHSDHYSHDRSVMGCRLACFRHFFRSFCYVVAKGSHRGSLHSTRPRLC